MDDVTEEKEGIEITEETDILDDLNEDPESDSEVEEEGDQIDREPLKWVCAKCEEQVDGLDTTYLKFCKKHPKRNGCKVNLVDINTGDIVATSLRDGQRKGLFKEPYNASKKDKAGIPKDGQPMHLGFFKTEKVVLSSRLFLQRQIFIQEKLVPADITMSDFLEGLADTLLEITGRKIAIVQIKK